MLKLHDHIDVVFPESRIRYDPRGRAMTTTSEKSLCAVCGGEVSPHTEATCDNCGRTYHLNQRTDLPGKDCGMVWINEDHLALEFGCNLCLNPEPPPENLDDVLDASEAAELTGMTEAALRRAAEQGELRHRRTASGVYLFARRDLNPLIQARR
jgi:hypothetical protein